MQLINSTLTMWVCISVHRIHPLQSIHAPPLPPPLYRGENCPLASQHKLITVQATATHQLVWKQNITYISRGTRNNDLPKIRHLLIEIDVLGVVIIIPILNFGTNWGGFFYRRSPKFLSKPEQPFSQLRLWPRKYQHFHYISNSG